MSELKVYRWQGLRRGTGRGVCTNEICAAHSKAELSRITGQSIAHLFNLGECINEKDIAVAMSKPGVVFWTPADGRAIREYQEA